MTFLLVTLLMFAILVTMIGFLLTTKSKRREQSPKYTEARSSHKVGDSVPLQGRRVVDAVVPVRRRYVDDSMPVPGRRVVESVPMRSSSLSMGQELRPARYISASAAWQRIGRRQKGEPIHWSVITIGLISIFILGLYIFNFVFPHQAFFNLVWFNQSTSASSSSNQQPDTVYHATQNLARIGQLDPAQYSSPQEYHLWAYSACSAASMTEVFDSYGHDYRITDILKVEAQIGEITPQQGLLEDIGIQRTAARFGFKTTWGHNLSLDQVIDTASRGRPVIVSFPPDRYAGGHLLVVIGGDSIQVLVADSSIWNRHAISRTQFLKWWEGFYAIVTPN